MAPRLEQIDGQSVEFGSLPLREPLQLDLVVMDRRTKARGVLVELITILATFCFFYWSAQASK